MDTDGDAVMTVGDAGQRLAVRLRAAGVPDARREATLLLAAASGLPRHALLLDPAHPLTPTQVARLQRLAASRERRQPLAYVLGRREFWSLEFAVGPGVLVPRPESETLVEAVLAAVPERRAPLRLLDLGTGSGCLLLALLKELPCAVGTGVDLSAEALAYAVANARRLGLTERARFVRGRWGQALAGGFDVVVCNPPYVNAAELATLEPEVREHEPHAALVAGADGLAAYRTLLPDLGRLLAPSGVAATEIGRGQGAAVATLARAAGLAVARSVADLAGVTRCLVFQHPNTSA